NKVVKPFRVLNISRDQDMRRKISCLEYIEEIYTEATDIPDVNYSELEITTEVSSISVSEETYRQKDGTMISNLNVAWSVPRDTLVSGYKVLYSSDIGQTWSEWSSGTALNTSIIGVRTQTNYLVKVCTISYVGIVSNGVVSSAVYVTGKDVPPSDVASLSAALDPADMTKINLSWSPVDDVDLAGYRIKTTIKTGTEIVENLAQITTYTYIATKGDPHTFSVTAVDNSGNESANPKSVEITPVIYPAAPKGFTAVQNGEYVYLYWNKNSETDVSGYEIRQGPTFDSGSLVQTGITGTDLSVPVNSETKYSFHIKAINNSGNYSEDATATVAIYGLPPKNMYLTFDELALQSGTHSDTQFGVSEYNCLTLPGQCDDDRYEGWQCNQVGGAVVLKLQGPLDYIEDIDSLPSFDDLTATTPSYGVYTTTIIDLGQVMKVNLAVDFISTALLSVGNSSTLRFCYGQDKDHLEEWKDFAPVTLTTQCIQCQVILSSTDQVPIEVGTFTVNIDVDDIETTGSTTVATGGSAIAYGYTFLGGPGPDGLDEPNGTPIFTPTAIGEGLRAEVISVGVSSARVKVVNAINGTDVGGTITYRVKGYGGL
ncbi:MAG: hypothetical protein P4N59_18900, partial [Negativicutes bacterium]|nr:hypothetical protein [Negativicutes bacterium]